MRYLRSKKFGKKYKKLLILTQILTIWYATLIIVGTLTSNTFAYLSDSDSTNISISSGSWWDGSDLAFMGKKETENIKKCDPIEIRIDLENKGSSMIGTTEYEVYFVDNGNPKENGSRVAEGVIQPIESGKTVTLTYLTEENGSYIFKVFQRPGYNDNYEERKELWSKKFMINCNASMTEKEMNEDNTISANDKKISEEQTNEQEVVNENQKNKKESESIELDAIPDKIEKENETPVDSEMDNNTTKTESVENSGEKPGSNKNEAVEEKESTTQNDKDNEVIESTKKGEE